MPHLGLLLALDHLGLPGWRQGPTLGPWLRDQEEGTVQVTPRRAGCALDPQSELTQGPVLS